MRSVQHGKPLIPASLRPIKNAAVVGRVQKPAVATEPVTRFSSDGARLRRQAGAALGAAALQDLASCFRGHAGTKTVRAGTLQGAGLKSAFHSLESWVQDFPGKVVQTKGRQGYAEPESLSIEGFAAFFRGASGAGIVLLVLGFGRV